MLTDNTSRKVVTRHGESTIPTNGLWFLEYEIWANGETRTASDRDDTVCLETELVYSVYMYILVGVSASRTRLLYRIVLYETEPKSNTLDVYYLPR